MDEVEHSRLVEFHGTCFEVTVTVRNCMEAGDAHVLSLEVESAQGERWQADFTGQYLEELTTKTGNFKRAGTLARMLVGALDGTAESVYIDLLTSADLDALGKKSSIVLPNHTGRRYLILTYATTFDRIHYPLPLDVDKPNEHSLSRQVRRLKEKLAAKTKELETLEAHYVRTSAQLRAAKADNDKLKKIVASRGRSPSSRPHPPSAPPPPHRRAPRAASPSQRRAPRAPSPASSSQRSSSFKRFDPTAYQKERERRIAAAAARRHQTWGASDDGYSSAGGHSSAAGYSSAGGYSSCGTRARNLSNSRRSRQRSRRKPKHLDSRPVPQSKQPRPCYFDRQLPTSSAAKVSPVSSPPSPRHDVPPKEDHIADIDRRLNALQAFLKEAKTKRF